MWGEGLSGACLIEVWSGGQDGADLGALFAAHSLGVPTAGYAPKGWLTEHGPDPTLARFRLRECPEPGYPARTRRNVEATDGTLLIGDRSSTGSALTYDHCRRIGRPCLPVGWTPERGPVPSPAAIEAVRAWIVARNIKRLNVAGNRERVAPGIQSATEALVRAVLVALDPAVARLTRIVGGTVESVDLA